MADTVMDPVAANQQAGAEDVEKLGEGM